MTDQTGKIAIVTGASRGIGAAVAARLAKDGLAVVINYSGDVKSAEALAGRIEAGGGRALAIKADVSDPKAVREMFERTEQVFGGVDVLINNAGIMKLAKIADSDDALFDQQVAINLKGSFNAMREAARRLRVWQSLRPAQPAEDVGVDFARIAMAEIVDLAIGDVAAGRR
jgi:3-oxoacyl-[acyl-carrier protein] reductase